MHAAQVRAARGLLSMKQADLAKAAGVSLPTVKRIEGMDGPLRIRLDTMQAIKTALEAAGVVFLDSKELGPGVALKRGADFVLHNPDRPGESLEIEAKRIGDRSGQD